MNFRLKQLVLPACLAAWGICAQPMDARQGPGRTVQLQAGIPVQNQTPPIGEQSVSMPNFTNSGQEYVLGPGDVIEVSVIGIPGLDQKEFALDGQGRISLPYLKQVRLQGMTAHEAEIKIAALYEVSLLEDPQVSVRIKEFKSQYCYVLGAVQKPGRFQLAQQISLLDALTLAGGLTDKADVRIMIYHSPAQPSQQGAPPGLPAQGIQPANSTPAQEINLADLLNLTDPQRNLVIHSGDIVNVPERRQGLYFVLGDIQRPGAFPIQNNEKATLSKALANAGGPLRTAAAGKTTIIRPKPGSDLPEQIKVDANAVLKGEIRDIELRENDVVLVPGSTSKTLGKNFLGGLNSFLASALIFAIF
jgi:polysaccharide biosynthesis/export protein